MNFSELGYKNEKEIRCVITQSWNKKIKVHYEDFEKIHSMYGDKSVIVYESNESSDNIVLNLLNESIKEEKGLTISPEDFIIELLGVFTNIELDLDAEKDKDKISKIVNKPTALFKAVQSEVQIICNEIFDRIYKNMQDFIERPTGLKEVVLQEVVNKMEAKEETEEEKKIKELEKQLKELKGEE